MIVTNSTSSPSRGLRKSWIPLYPGTFISAIVEKISSFSRPRTSQRSEGLSIRAKSFRSRDSPLRVVNYPRLAQAMTSARTPTPAVSGPLLLDLYFHLQLGYLLLFLLRGVQRQGYGCT